MTRSTLIIGGGIGGLFTGALLSKAGREVTVLEKNAVIGGGLQSFVRFGEVFDTGMHIAGGLHEGGSVSRICAYLGIRDRMHLQSFDPRHTDTVRIGADEYRLPAGREAFVEALSAYFPAERTGVQAYMEALYRLSRELPLFDLQPSGSVLEGHSEEFFLPVRDFIARYVNDGRLQALLAYLNPLYGGRGERTPACIHALLSVLQLSGPARLAGGSVHLATLLREVIEAGGGRVVSGDAVTAVQSERRRLTGVTTASGRQWTADDYVSAIHPCSLLALMDHPEDLPKAYRSRLEGLPLSFSAFLVNIKFRPGTFPYLAHTGFCWEDEASVWQPENSLSHPGALLYMTPPEERQDAWARKMILIAPMAWEEVRPWASASRDEAYRAWKQRQAEVLLGRMEGIFPGFQGLVEAYDTSSPLTIRDYYGTRQGAMYGFMHDASHLAASQVPVVTKIPNLYLTGQNCSLHGLCGVTLTAVATAEALLGSGAVLGALHQQEERK